MSKIARLMKPLREYHSGGLRLCENASLINTSPGVLCTLEGPIASYIVPTRNNRLYPRALWDRLIKSSYVQEMLKTLTFYGEADHPFEWEDRYETHIPEVCISVRKLWLDDSKGAVMAIIDVLDTPNGRIIKTLADYGSILGISSRGSGNVIDTATPPTVDADSYVFFAFDIVAMPGNVTARLSKSPEITNLPIEAEKESMLESFRSQLNEAIDRRDTIALTNMSTLMEYSNISDEFSDLRESMNRVMNQSSESSPNTISESEVDDLLEAHSKIVELSEERSRLVEQIDRLKGLCRTARDTIVELNDQHNSDSESIESYAKLVEDITEENASLLESVNRLEGEKTSLNESLSKELDKSSRLCENYESIKVELESKCKELDTMHRTTKKLSALNESHKREVNSISTAHSSELQALNESLSYSKSKASLFMEGYIRLKGKSLGLNESYVRRVLDNEISDPDKADELLRSVMKDSTRDRLLESATPVSDDYRSISYESNSELATDKSEMNDLTSVVRAVGNIH